MKRKEYISPEIKLETVFLENGVAAGSDNEITIGGPNNSSSPDIENAFIEDKTFDITF